MSISAVKGILWAAVAIAVAMFLAAMSTAFDRHECLALVLGAAVVAVAATLWYRRAMPAAEAREEARQADLLATLKQQLALTRAPIAVKAASGVLFLALPACVTIYYAGLALVRPEVGSFLGFVLGLFVTLVLGLVYGPRIGKPALTIRPDGIEIPLLGFLGWYVME
jgi:hypothetical protein